MSRPDLLALTDDDLTDYANRGTVRRARREVEAGTVPEITEADDGTIAATFSDGVVATIPPGAPVTGASCSCPAAGVCRHLVTAVLAYQAGAAGAEDGAASSTAEPWDPGAITDEALTAALRPVALRRARRLWETGVAVTVVGGAKPAAEVHDAQVGVRFLVPGEPAYTRCDCSEADPCEHAAIAVWAFRHADTGAGPAAALVDTTPPPEGPPPPALRELERTLEDLVEVGFAGAAQGLGAVLADAATRCRDAGLSWLADIADELAEQQRRYATGDATFSAVAAAQLVGEAVVRVDALRSESSAAPRLFVAGPPDARPREVRGGRLVGLGCAVRSVGRVVHVDALVCDTATGRMGAIGRTTADGDGGEPVPYWRLAETTVGGATLRSIGAGQVVATGARRAPGGRLTVGRRPSSVAAQAFAWEEVLRPPLLAPDAATARAARAALVPAPLGPRVIGRGLVALGLSAVDDCGFDAATQAVVGLARDAAGDEVAIEHPYTTRGAEGCERLLAGFTDAREGRAAPRWIAGFADVVGGTLRIRPTGVVLDPASGPPAMVQPWVDRAAGAGHGQARGALEASGEGAGEDPEAVVGAALDDTWGALGELLISGTGRVDPAMTAGWNRTVAQLDALGSVRLQGLSAALHDALDRRRRDTSWTPRDPVAPALALLAVLELVRGR